MRKDSDQGLGKQKSVIKLIWKTGVRVARTFLRSHEEGVKNDPFVLSSDLP